MQDRSQFLLKQSLLLAFALVILCSFFSIGGRLDLKLIAPFVDLTGHFPLKNHWALAQLNHRYVKNILILVYLSFLLGWLASFKFQAWQTRRWEFGYYFGMVVISTVLIGILKSQSAHAAHGIWLLQALRECLGISVPQPATVFPAPCFKWICLNGWLFCLSRFEPASCLFFAVFCQYFRTGHGLGTNDAWRTFPQS